MKAKVITEIKGIFNTLFSNFKIMHLQDTQAYWTGNFYLESFIQNLDKLRVKNLNAYTFLINNYKEDITESKKLTAKLKLQELPIPSIFLYHNSHCQNFENNNTSYTIKIDNQGVWGNFYDFYKSQYAGNIIKSKQKATAEEERYLAMVNPVIKGICDITTNTIYHYLTSVYRKSNI